MGRSLDMDAHDNVLIVIAELLAEDIDAARPLRAFVDPDAQPDGVMLKQAQFGERDIRRLRTVYAGPGPGYDPGGQVAALRAFQLPPAGSETAPLVAVVAGRGPGPDLHVIDPDA